MYSYMNYIAYVLYPPLYIAGPIITFNDFMWQVSVLPSYLAVNEMLKSVLQQRRPTPISSRSTMKYLLRFIISFMTMEFILHFMYVVAIKDRKAWVGAGPAQISMIGFWNLIIVWLKVSLGLVWKVYVYVTCSVNDGLLFI
jgi:D-alanyl-lipoteichoic acid acyltransferase DltB (MBOAT superfamily)